jgi:predicted dinucleotide-binding enzyme
MGALLIKAGPSARAASTGEAALASDIVLLATPWEATEAAVRDAGDLAGKIVVDATNPLLPNLAGLAAGTTTSGGELVASWAPGARVVKAFNTIGSNIMENPRFGNQGAALFYCGDHPEAKSIVRRLAADLGFDPHDVGPLAQARLLEPMALLWISMALFHGYSRDIGFQLLRRNP